MGPMCCKLSRFAGVSDGAIAGEREPAEPALSLSKGEIPRVAGIESFWGRRSEAGRARQKSRLPPA
jgi:hypothetical protein